MKRCARVLTRRVEWPSAIWGLALLPLLGCQEAETSVPMLARVVAVAPVERRDLVESIPASGQILALDRARIAAQVSGAVTEKLVDEGTLVEQGAVLAVLDSESRQVDVRAARAHLAEADATFLEQGRNLERMEGLRREKVASSTDLDTARTALAVATARRDGMRAALQVAERSLRDASITAPFRGVIARHFVSRGEFVTPGTALVELVALDPVEVEFHLPESDVGRLAIGQKVGVNVAPFPEERFEGELDFISPTIDERTRTIRVKARIPNPGHRLRPGLFAHVDLGIRDRPGVLLIPEDALLQSSRGPIVYRVTKNHHAEEVSVRTGTFLDGMVEVSETSLVPTDLVVIRGQSRLTDGTRVSVRTKDGRPAEAAAPAAAAS